MPVRPLPRDGLKPRGESLVGDGADLLVRGREDGSADQGVTEAVCVYPAEHVRATIEAQEREEAEVGGAPREPVVRVPEAEPRTAGVTTGSAERAPAGARSRSFRPGAPS